MIALSLALTLSLGGVDTVAPFSINKLNFKGPASWQRAQPDINSLEWLEPDSGASMAISVFPVDPIRPAQACVKQIVEALGTEGFQAINVAAQPASRKITNDFVGDQKVDANKVTTTTVVGCNGKTKWVLTWTAKTSAGGRFGPMLKRVLDSFTYVK
ncbi:MAG: hypothetical protein ACO1OB_23415 [Archangium sp.]